jgi:hypothetical protein
MSVIDNSFFFLLITALFLLGRGRRTLAFHAPRATPSVRRCEGKIDVFLRIEADHERGHVYDLLSDPVPVPYHMKQIKRDAERAGSAPHLI